MIGTYADLQTAVADALDRTDLTAKIPDFIARAHILIQEYTGELNGSQPDGSLQNPTDTNNLLAYDPYIYVDGAAAEGFKHLRDMPQYGIYLAAFKSRLNKLAATGYARLGIRPAIRPAPVLVPRRHYYANASSWCDDVIPPCA